MNADFIGKVVHGVSLIGEVDTYLFREGNHARLYEVLGAHMMESAGEAGVLFAVWAPNAASVSVIGDFNGWDSGAHELAPRWDSSGIWEGFIPGVPAHSLYKFSILTQGGERLEKGDPFARFWETPPGTASVVCPPDGYAWRDAEWLAARGGRAAADRPQSVYEVHAGSWRRAGDGGYLGWQGLAAELVPYLADNGFTHVEFLPVMEHPFYGSWGYQTTGYFAPTSRYGSPDDLKQLVDELHAAGIGVILDWVPSHFPGDAYGLHKFDGTFLYEHEDPRKGFHPDWKTYIFNYGRGEVRSFLLSSARFWMDKFHADGLRVDAVASMLYLNYSRKSGEWLPNAFGGVENIEAVDFLRKMNETLYLDFPGIQTTAEESTSWPKVSSPVYQGGLGFGYKWNMGWMHDVLFYLSKDPVFRRYHQNSLTFGMWYAYSENFVLPLSHDEVVYGKGSLWGKMPGDAWQKAANLRLLYGWMFGHPGKKLLFMGGEFGQEGEWRHEYSLDWHLLGEGLHNGVLRWYHDINKFYRDTPALWELDNDTRGFEWIDSGDAEASVVSLLRRDKQGNAVIFINNFTPVPRHNYRIGVPGGRAWREVLNSDSQYYGGSGAGNGGRLATQEQPWHGRARSMEVTLPPLSCLVFEQELD